MKHNFRDQLVWWLLDTATQIITEYSLRWEDAVCYITEDGEQSNHGLFQGTSLTFPHKDEIQRVIFVTFLNDNIAADYGMNNEWWIWKDMAGRGDDILYGTILTLAWRD